MERARFAQKNVGLSGDSGEGGWEEKSNGGGWEGIGGRSVGVNWVNLVIKIKGDGEEY